MEAPVKPTTDYALVEAFMQHLLTLTSNELTTFYCETCYQRLDIPQEARPSDPFQEKFGTCIHCDRHEDISNPHINRFLNERGLTLQQEGSLILRREEDETTTLIRDWLIPNDYATFRYQDKSHNEEASFTWVKYGRKQEKNLYRSSIINQESKTRLLPFYPLCYSLDRFTAEPAREPDEKITDVASPSLSDEFTVQPEACNQWPNKQPSRSTFAQFRAFVANML